MNPKPTISDLQCDDIIKIVTISVWEQADNDGEPPIPALLQLQDFTQAQTEQTTTRKIVIPARERYEVYTISEEGGVEALKREILKREQESVNASLAWLSEALKSHPGDLELGEQATLKIDMGKLDKPFTRESLLKEIEKPFAKFAILQDKEDFDAVANYLLTTAGEPTAERLEGLHQEWLRAKGIYRDLKHPLAPMVRAWSQDITIPRIKPERRQNTGIMLHKIRDSFPSGETQGEGFDIGSFPQGSREIQGTLPGFEFPESEIVPALPLVAYNAAGGTPGGRGRGAPIDQRLFVNLLIEYPKHEHLGVARLETTYRDILSWLYPNGTTASKKDLVPRLREGFKSLHKLWFEWERREWNIIAVDALPTMETKPDDQLSFTVRMPEGMNTGGGARIGLKALRSYGAKSAPKFRAWVRLAYLWDAAKVKNGGKRIYATIPEVLRDKDGHLTDAKGQKILTGELYSTKNGWKVRKGNLPQTAWYHPLAIKTGRHVRNPQADKVPILDDADMVKLFYDHDKRKGEAFRKALYDARKHAEAIAENGFIVIEEDAVDQKTGKAGVRILEALSGESKTIL